VITALTHILKVFAEYLSSFFYLHSIFDNDNRQFNNNPINI
jgi:hypothetical protein